jgi:hypothetical protein
MLREDRPVVLAELHPLQLERVSGASPASFVSQMHDLGYRCHALGAGVAGEEVAHLPSSGVTSVVFLPDRARSPSAP